MTTPRTPGPIETVYRLLGAYAEWDLDLSRRQALIRRRCATMGVALEASIIDAHVAAWVAGA